jgi:YidC/Oxa1 family membrane protein insertase
MVQKVMLYGMPLSLFVTGFFFPIGVLLYWTTNNLWTLGQQYFILRKLPPPGSDAAKAKAAAGKPVIDPKTLAPKPGAKPVRAKQGRPAATSTDTSTATTDDSANGAAPTGSSESGVGSANGSRSAGGSGSSGKAGTSGGRSPGGKSGSAPANRGKRKRR